MKCRRFGVRLNYYSREDKFRLLDWDSVTICEYESGEEMKAIDDLVRESTVQENEFQDDSLIKDRSKA